MSLLIGYWKKRRPFPESVLETPTPNDEPVYKANNCPNVNIIQDLEDKVKKTIIFTASFRPHSILLPIKAAPSTLMVRNHWSEHVERTP